MGSKKSKELIDQMTEEINARIDKLLQQVEDLFKSQMTRWERDDQMLITRYIGFLETDTEWMERSEVKEELMWRISDHLIEISAFIDYHDVPEMLVDFFYTASNTYSGLFFEKYGISPACLTDWTNTVKKYRNKR